MKDIDEKNLKEIISRFSKGKVLVVGDLILDEFVRGNVSRISPEAPIPIVEVFRESFMPGGAANVGSNIASLKGKVFLSGVIGTDRTGDTLLAELSKQGLDTQGIIKDKDRPTTLKTRIIAHHQQVVRVDRERKDPLGDVVLKQLLDFCQKIAPEVEVIIIEDYGKGVVTENLLQELRGLKGKTIVIDPRMGSFSSYKGADVITPNRHEAEVALEMKMDSKESLHEGGKQLLEKFELKSALITLGEEGMCLFQEAGEITHIPTVAREVYDVSGAGDSVASTLALALSVGASLKEASYLSNMAAGIVVGKEGTAVVSPEELIGIISES